MFSLKNLARKGLINIPDLSSLLQGNAITKTCGATSNAKIDILTTLGFQRHHDDVMAWARFLHSLQWRHNRRDGVSNHQHHDCLLKRLLRCRSKKTSKLRVTGLCDGNSPVAGEFPAQRPVTRKCFHLMTSSWLALCEGSQRAGNEELSQFLWCHPKQAVEQTAK